MATRFYFQSTGTAAVSPAFDAGWEQTGQATRRPLVRKSRLAATTALTDSGAITIPITTTQQICAWQFVSGEVFKPATFTTGDTLSMVLRCSESATTAPAFLAYSLRAFTPNGATLLATLASSLANTGTEYGTTQETRIFSAVALTAAVLAQPFRLALDIGSHAQAPTAAGSFVQRVGSAAASDFALTSALTTDLNPWAELSLDLRADVTLQHYQHVQGASGLSVTERRR